MLAFKNKEGRIPMAVYREVHTGFLNKGRSGEGKAV
jgi:hypothetical protein